MSVTFYLDVHVPRAIAEGLRTRGVDLITAQEDKSTTFAHHDLLDRATQLGRVVVTFDDDFLAEAHRRQVNDIPFGGVIYGRQIDLTIGQIIRDLQFIAFAGDPMDLSNRVEYLPL